MAQRMVVGTKLMTTYQGDMGKEKKTLGSPTNSGHRVHMWLGK
jgi:hypothetical protein